MEFAPPANENPHDLKYCFLIYLLAEIPSRPAGKTHVLPFMLLTVTIERNTQISLNTNFTNASATEDEIHPDPLHASQHRKDFLDVSINLDSRENV